MNKTQSTPLHKCRSNFKERPFQRRWHSTTIYMVILWELYTLKMGPIYQLIEHSRSDHDTVLPECWIYRYIVESVHYLWIGGLINHVIPVWGYRVVRETSCNMYRGGLIIILHFERWPINCINWLNVKERTLFQVRRRWHSTLLTLLVYNDPCSIQSKHVH